MYRQQFHIAAQTYLIKLKPNKAIVITVISQIQPVQLAYYNIYI